MTIDRALIVEDSPSIGEYLKSILQARFSSDVVTSAELALYKLKANQYQIVVLDLHLPGMSGLEMLKKTRAEDNITPIVVLTGQGSVRVALEALQQGADWFVEKQDFTPEELVEVIERAIDRRRGLLAQDELGLLRKRFYAAITHDLRSPVGNALMAVELMEGAEPGSEDDLAGRRLARLSLERAMHLIERYLDYEKINAGFLDLQLRQADVVPVVESAVLGTQARAKAARQSLSLEVVSRPPQLRIDPERLLNVFENLISNALRYTPSGGTVSVKIEQDTDAVRVSVSDSGKGIRAEDMEKIFLPFRRSPGDKTTGTGLGLAIARETVAAHGGKIEVESEGVAGKGSVFRVLLPLASDAGEIIEPV